jgi:hypothetical protein
MPTPIKTATEFRVNTTTAGDQIYPDNATLTGGDFVVVWSSQNQDGSGWGIYGQRYGADGNVNGGEFLINTFTTGNQIDPRPTALSDGGFVATKYSDAQDPSAGGVQSVVLLCQWRSYGRQ